MYFYEEGSTLTTRVVFSSLELLVLASSLFNNMLYIFSMSESVENLGAFRPLVTDSSGNKRRSSLLILRGTIVGAGCLLSFFSSNLELILAISGTYFCSFVNYLIPHCSYF